MSGCRGQTTRYSGPETGAWENSVATQTRKHCEFDSKRRTKVNYEKFYIKNFFRRLRCQKIAELTWKCMVGSWSMLSRLAPPFKSVRSSVEVDFRQFPIIFDH